ncbi:flavoprotein monooxygenase [Mycena polygramma]|nr:flavoprotein monooxygenase [Mycena polygramma]
MSGLKILVSGAGIAGPSCAYWLSRSGARVTMIERSPSPRKTGQAIDIRGPGVKVMQKMGLEAAIKARHTTEKGLQKLGSTGAVVATFDSTGDPAKQSITSEYEILRADLARLLEDKCREDGRGVEIVYGECVQGIAQDAEGVDVTFTNGRQPERYDLVVAADGALSRTRALASGHPAKDDLERLNEYTAFFTLPRAESDSITHARMYNAPGGRGIMLRPTPTREEIGGYLMCDSPADKARFQELAASGKVDEQKRMLGEYFADLADGSWETERVLEGMKKADDFYFSEGALTRLNTYSYGRVVCIGDAAHAVMGVGTAYAMYGGYVVAGELTKIKSAKDVPAALLRYEAIMKPLADKAQNFPKWVHGVMLPQTRLGVTAVNAVFYAIDSLRIPKLVQYFGANDAEENIPEYEWVKE